VQKKNKQNEHKDNSYPVALLANSALQKHVGKTPIEKTHLTPLTERRTLKDNTFCHYLHDYG
jgi:hypothetical protein